jgi:hypothetical protein
VGESERSRDEGASLRLTAAALRLAEFTVRQLAESAGANYETARDFVARRKASGVLVPVYDTEIAAFSFDEETAAAGRPPQRYKISDIQRSLTEKRLKEIRSTLSDVARSTADHATVDGDGDEFGPLVIFERAVRALSLANVSGKEREAHIADIEILRDAAEKDVLALATHGADSRRVLRFGRRLGSVTTQYEELRQQYGTISDVSESWRPVADEFVFACHGHWTGGVATAKAINQFVVLLDGIPKSQDPVTSRLVRDCTADAVSVAAFDIGTFRPGDWDQMRNYLRRIHALAPSVVTGMFVTVDGSTPLAQSMIDEVSRFDKLQAVYGLAPLGFHVGTILGSAEKHLGRIFCLDAVSAPRLGQTCKAVGINYVAAVADAG